MATTEWDTVVARLRTRWGCDLDLGDIAARFLPFFRGPRIRADVGAYRPLTGRVSITTGWRPALILMQRATDDGSPWVLRPHHDLLAVQISGRYVPVDDPRVVSMFAAYAARHGGIR